MERPETKLTLSILGPLMRFGEKEITKERYIEHIEMYERKCEKSLIDTFKKLDIHATVKTDPYSLPYTDEVFVSLSGESYLNGPYELHRVTRQIVKTLLKVDAHKIRFYMFINVTPKGLMGQMEYRFRYYVHY
jgi:hypothetical protein